MDADGRVFACDALDRLIRLGTLILAQVSAAEVARELSRRPRRGR